MIGTIIANLIGLLLIAAIVWWFWIWKPRAQSLRSGVIDIEVANGVYTPPVVEVKRGEAVTLRFHRRDASPCAEQVVFHGLDISETLPLNGTRDIALKAERSGEFRFTCQMQMYQGLLRVRD